MDNKYKKKTLTRRIPKDKVQGIRYVRANKANIKLEKAVLDNSIQCRHLIALEFDVLPRINPWDSLLDLAVITSEQVLDINWFFRVSWSRLLPNTSVTRYQAGLRLGRIYY